MFEQIQSRLDKILTSIRGEGKITESNIDSALRDVRRALFQKFGFGYIQPSLFGVSK